MRGFGLWLAKSIDCTRANKPPLITKSPRETVRKVADAPATSPYGTPRWYLSARFGLRMLPKSTVEALLLPLFGQFQKGHSRKPAFIYPHAYTVSGRR